MPGVRLIELGEDVAGASVDTIYGIGAEAFEMQVFLEHGALEKKKPTGRWVSDLIAGNSESLTVCL